MPTCLSGLRIYFSTSLHIAFMTSFLTLNSNLMKPIKQSFSHGNLDNRLKRRPSGRNLSDEEDVDYRSLIRGMFGYIFLTQTFRCFHYFLLQAFVLVLKVAIVHWISLSSLITNIYFFIEDNFCRFKIGFSINLSW